VVTQEAGIHFELLDKLRQNVFTDFRSVGCGRFHQLYGN
jgi:hypothetical protein